MLVAAAGIEEEFDWSAPFDRAHTAVGHMAAIHRVQDVFEALGMVQNTWSADTDRACDDWLRHA